MDMKLPKDINELFGGAKVAAGVKEALEALVENVLCTTHTMAACIEIYRLKDNFKEVDPLCQALLLDLVNQMKLRMDKAIDHLEKEGKKENEE